MVDSTITTIRGATPGDPLNQPINKSNDYLAMVPYWDIVDVLLAGVEELRNQGEKYLPKFQNETPTQNAIGKSFDPYNERLRHAPLTNIFEDITLNLSSKPFAHELQMTEETKEPYTTFAEDIDMMGNNLHSFGQEMFKIGVQYAVSWVLVDYSKAAPRLDGQPLSIADERDQGLRPYWVHLPPTTVFAVYSDVINGEEQFVHVRIHEPTVKLDGYIERVVNRVRVIQREPTAWDIAGKPTDYGPPLWFVYEEVIQPGQDTGAWVLIEEGEYSIGVIPLVPFMTGSRVPATWRVVPPLKGIAYLQIEEYQQESNLKTVLEQAAFPMLSGDGVTPPDGTGTKISAGPRTVLFGGSSVDGRPGSWKYIEPSGTSIKVLQDQLENTRNEMRDLGKQPLTLQNQTVITTGQIAVKANSTVQAWAIKFKDALEQCWKYTAMWLGNDDEPEVNVFMDFNAALDTGIGWQAVFQLRQLKDISHETALACAARYGYLPENFDIKQNDEELAAEQDAAQLRAEQMINPINGQPVGQQPNQQNQQSNGSAGPGAAAGDFASRVGSDRFRSATVQ